MSSAPLWRCLPLLLAVGCGAQPLPTETPAPTARRTGPAGSEPVKGASIWSECYSLFQPTGEPRADLARLTRSCGPTGGMQAVTPVQVARQADKDPADRYTFYVAKAGACFRVYATGDRNIQDLDLLLRGPDGTEVVADLTHDSFPVLPTESPVCFDVPGLYMLEVSVFRGGGEYAVQVWGNADGLGPKPSAQKR